MRRLLAGLTVTYAVGLLSMLLAVAHWGERHPVLNLCLYLPPLVWLLPVVVLAPLSLFLRPRLCLWQLGCVAIVLWPFMGLQWRFGSHSREPDLVCVTNNIATSHGFSLKPFLDQQNPDIVALQDAATEGRQVVQELADRHTARLGQFTLISRYAILKNEPVALAPFPDEPVAARSELDFGGRLIAIYNVRLPSPRRDLQLARSGLGALRRNPARIHENAPWDAYAAMLPLRVELTRNLLATLRQEPLPYIVLGDFNTPSVGSSYRLLAGALTDCFTAAGSGFGFTFPGDSGYFLSIYRPWMRLDYVFTDRHWEPISISVENSRRSEHRAVAARLRFVPGKSG